MVGGEKLIVMVGKRSPPGPSNAPTSHAAPIGRLTPRWSASGHPTVLPASRAGLPGSKPIVRVGPPLSASGPTFGSVLFRLSGAVRAALASEQMLWPRSVIAPRQLLLEESPPTIVLSRNVNAPLSVAMLAPKFRPPLGQVLVAEPPLDRFAQMVQLVARTRPPLFNAPPMASMQLPPAARLLTRVTLTNVFVPKFNIAPPPAIPPVPLVPADE